MHPKCLTIQNVEVLGGDFPRAWKGVYEGEVVCLKVIRSSSESNVQALAKEYMQEAITWSQLKHPNILPLIGIHFVGEVKVCLVSPWMERGNLVQFLGSAPREHVDHLSLASGVASGIAYLHHANMVHGNLKGVNILITTDLKACIGGFGSLRIVLDLNEDDDVYDHPRRSAIRWTAPELLKPETYHVTTTQSDMYAFGCVCYKIFTRHTPFYNLYEHEVSKAVLYEHRHPSRPVDAGRILTDVIWEFMASFWNHDPSLRPTAVDAIDRIQHLANSMKRGDIQAAPDWSWFDPEKKHQGNVEYSPLDLELLFQI
ncbi:hypothetical protein AAF712_009016 [Marasmius tenuissimus]|uniref:Protein kinase domain-containing protein n=1 Tax=Marasmius tenuissimus TaxID=585030 RepID=A0ABR2ZQU4_9AGAR